MSDLFEEPESGENAPEFTVAEISGAIKRTVEGAFQRVRVRGELGRVSRPASGHLYLDLKDDRAVLSGVIWKGTAQRLATRPEEGMEVIATGRLTTFPGQSRYQMIIENIAPAGAGALMAMLEKRKAELEAQGLFAAERKQPIPYLPEVVGVVTSPSGAVIRDILHRLRDRFPRKVLVWGVRVQGQGSAEEIAAAIEGFNSLTSGGAVPRPDVLIVARGGGSVEDLWSFNEEIVVRAAADSEIPLISAVGHETDTTLIDFASDRRAPTPTAAAEMAVPVRADLIAHVATLEARRRKAFSRLLDDRRQRLRDLSRALPRPDAIIGERNQRYDGVAPRLDLALRSYAQQKRIALVSGPGGRFAPSLLSGTLSRQRDGLRQRDAALSSSLVRRVERASDRLGRIQLNPRGLKTAVSTQVEGLERIRARMQRASASEFRNLRQRLAALDRVRTTVGYKETLKRGFAVVRDAEGRALSLAEQARSVARLEIEFADGRVPAVQADAPVKKSSKSASGPVGQGSLF
ncbi:exodeoxyribonuclease VII large subunit [Algicella marina]|uniref:Exodeoxyribonuclease 7 large subunit n=1 Tax=Algicella marina TaxID=2683284 RepID=A0A6P1SWE7_9RHOB|nr:exodeoxyribonuclease VII large subunit [Algicella marina]QHQ34994.1 exodeoxyribonuclease VII large subunit [Algicella marina]